MNKQWVIYDVRYRIDPDSAAVMECCGTLKEAHKNAPDYGDDTVIVEYDTDGKHLMNPKIIN